LVFDTEINNKSYDILVKDLSIDKLMPVLILNTDGEVAFDQFNGFYYTQVDPNGKGQKVFRHQLGTLHHEDVLFYEETNPDFRV
jgi:protease II